MCSYKQEEIPGRTRQWTVEYLRPGKKEAMISQILRSTILGMYGIKSRVSEKEAVTRQEANKEDVVGERMFYESNESMSHEPLRLTVNITISS